jgi:hypothetical protein
VVLVCVCECKEPDCGRPGVFTGVLTPGVLRLKKEGEGRSMCCILCSGGIIVMTAK